ncbi:phthiocerol/phthiodiolone dimycocerosyl transferase family protein [Nocardia brasiliensis]|uniref:Phthiocerol/phthiodiolone dimycocerosyl transferase n=1 Tax=Nocardia brasiliensis (strain ATCC 700358 / HUJEG-1) TaxID=1133849 RepID=K0FB89_NOCB7|nr:acyltransferase [Nocardia brasiliensis]AFU04706.1 acyltransferase PapA5 [Nocardia brasiliensis ATCC 700358]OCF88316.1 hypothetical protein AW168_21760 [Nocardia brasiliensis]
MSIEATTETLVRALDGSELQFAAVGYCVGYSVCVHGVLELESLTEAFTTLQTANPVLSCRIVASALGGAALARAGDAPYIRVRDNAYSATGSTGIGHRTAGIEVQYEDVDTAWVTLLIHHAIADAGHALRMVEDLWRYYTAAIDGREVAVQRQPYPQSTEFILRHHGIDDVDPRPEADPVTAARDSSTTPNSTAAPVGLVRLTSEQTRAVIELGHAAGATVNGLVSAALLCAVADAAEVDLPEVRYSFPVDLRSRLEPPVGLTEATNMLSMARFAPPPGSSADLLELARAVTGKLACDLADGSLTRYYFYPSDQIAAWQAEYSYRPATVSATNWGVIPELVTPDSLIVRDFRPHPQVTDPVGASVMTPLAPYYVLFIYTFQGQLSITGLAPSAAEAEELAELLRHQLHRLTSLST